MIKFLMALAMAALIGSAVVAGLNNRKLNDEQVRIVELTSEYNRLNSDLDQAEQDLETSKVALQTAQTANQQIKADKSLTEDDLRRKTNESDRLTANYESRRAQLEELAVLKESLGSRTPEMVKAQVNSMSQRRSGLQTELRELEDEVVTTQNQVDKNRQKVADLNSEESERRNKVSLQGLEADLIAINREMGFVIINAGTEHGVTPDSALLVLRGVDRIGRLRIVSVEPQVTVADIMPGSVAPGASLMVRDKVIFENLR